MKTKVKIIIKGQSSFNLLDTGYIDGYVSGGDGLPCAVVVVECKIELIPITHLEVIL